jgi:hypothetical protein
MRILMNICSRVLFFCLRILPSHYTHFTLYDTNKALEAVIAAYTQLQNDCTENECVVLHTADIKNMFTELPHDEILRACNFVIAAATAHTRRDRFSVRRTGTSGVRWGRAYNNHKHVEVCIKTIHEVIEFDLQNVFFTVGDSNLLQQTVGAPMGGYLSAGYAIIVCAHREIIFHTSLGADRPLLKGMRFMDDSLAMIRTHKQDRRKEQELWRKMCTHYHQSMVVEETPPDAQGCHSFLQLTLHTHNNDIVTSLHLKNLTSLLANGKRPFPSYVEASSFTPTRQLYANVTMALHRAVRACSDLPQLFTSIMLLLSEFVCLGYPKTTLTRAVRAFEERAHKNRSEQPQNVWRLVLVNFGVLYR